VVIVERVTLRAHAQKKTPHELSAHGFQRWLEGWKERQADGWIVRVWVARDASHAIGMACRPDEGE
jgi:hypothetical protein